MACVFHLTLAAKYSSICSIILSQSSIVLSNGSIFPIVARAILVANVVFYIFIIIISWIRVHNCVVTIACIHFIGRRDYDISNSRRLACSVSLFSDIWPLTILQILSTAISNVRESTKLLSFCWVHRTFTEFFHLQASFVQEIWWKLIQARIHVVMLAIATIIFQCDSAPHLDSHSWPEGRIGGKWENGVELPDALCTPIYHLIVVLALPVQVSHWSCLNDIWEQLTPQLTKSWCWIPIADLYYLQTCDYVCDDGRSFTSVRLKTGTWPGRRRTCSSV